MPQAAGENEIRHILQKIGLNFFCFFQKLQAKSDEKVQEGRRQIKYRFIHPEAALQNLKCNTGTQDTVSHKTSPADIRRIALGYDVWKADAWSESGMATKILFTKKGLSWNDTEINNLALMLL